MTRLVLLCGPDKKHRSAVKKKNGINADFLFALRPWLVLPLIVQRYYKNKH